MLFAVGCVVLFVFFFALGELFLIPHLYHRSHRKQTQCANHLRQLGGVFTCEAMEDPEFPREGGVPLLIAFRRKEFIQRGSEEIFTCPEDPDVHIPETKADSAAYDTVDLSDAEALGRLCSYAVRDFERYPLDPKSKEAQWIMCDRQGLDGRTPHHKGGIFVLFADGAVQFKDREFLGLGPDDPSIVGPDSPHAELRKMIIVPAD